MSPPRRTTVRTEEPEPGVRRIVLDRPERLNAITPLLVRELADALREADADPEVRAIILTGAGRAFCSGDDLKEFGEPTADPEQTRDYVLEIQAVTEAMVLGATPVVGAIRGWAVGGGLEWVINCDLAIAARGSRFFFPELSWGLFVTGGVTALLPQLVGLQRARELILFGERFDADQALDWGLLWRVVDDAELDAVALETARRIAALPPARVADLKRILAGPALAGIDRAMAAETEATVAGFLDPETARRIAAFGAG